MTVIHFGHMENIVLYHRNDVPEECIVSHIHTPLFIMKNDQNSDSFKKILM